MDDINGMKKYSTVNSCGKYYTRSEHSKRKSATKPLDNVIIKDGVNQQDGKQNSVHALVNVKQTNPMVMFNGSSKPIWSGNFKISSKACLEVDAHLSSIACKKVEECSKSLQPVLEVVKLPRLQVWPKGWKLSGPKDVGLYLLPSNARSIEALDELVNEVIKTDSALKVTAATADLLVFPSVLLPEQNHLYQGKHYLWGLFRRRKDISDEVVLGGEQKGSACALPGDEGGQQAHLLNQVDEAQLASSEEITFAMNDSLGENPALVESTCEAQIDEDMDLDIVVLGGEQNGSACDMPIDEGGQQAQHLLSQVDEASSEQIICAMNSHVENPPLIECTCEAQIDEAMETITGECLTTFPGSSLSVTKQPNSPKAVSNCSAHHPEEMSQPGDTFTSSSFLKACIGTRFFTSSSTKPTVSSVAAQLAKKTGHGQSCSGSKPVTTRMFGVDIARKPGAQEHIEDVATEGVSVPTTGMVLFSETPTEMVTTDSVSDNSPRVTPGWTAVGAGLNAGTNHQQHSEGVPPQPDVEPSQGLELFPVRVEQMGLADPGAGTSNNIMEVDLELSLGMPSVLHL